MARRNIQDLAALLDIYRQFSPEQKAREALIQAQTASANQGVEESKFNLESRRASDPVDLEMKRGQAKGIDLANLFEMSAQPNKLKAIDQGLQLTTEQIAAAKAQNELSTAMNPLAIDFARKSNPLQIGVLQGQQTALQNENSIFDQKKKLGELNIQEATQNIAMAPQESQSRQNAQAASAFMNLKVAQLNPDGTDPQSLAEQQMLRNLGGTALPPTLTPHLQLYKGISPEDRQRFTEVQMGIITDPKIISYLFTRYPEQAPQIIPNKAPR